MGSKTPHANIILLLVFLFLSLLFMLPKPAPPSYRSSELEKIENGDTTEYYLDGQLTYASDLHYARMVKTTTGNEVLLQYYDEKGLPAKQSAGHYALLRVYDNKQEVSRTYLDEHLKPMLNTSGYSIRDRVFRDGHVAEIWYKGTDGAPIATNSGIYGELNGWENGRNTVITYVDADGKPHSNKSGYAVLRRTFYEEKPIAGKVKEQYYFDAAGEPVSLEKGQYGVHNEYDELGRTVRIDYLGADGSVISSTVRTYNPDDSMATEMYYDANGRPLQQAAGQYGIKKAGGKTLYLDADGNVYWILNQYLHDEPLVVICVGALVLILSAVSAKRVNTVLLVLYIGFIVYMTLWARDGTTRGNFELFWSYRQFMSSPSLRLEIMNNIWLFVPLGGILARLGLGRKSVLVCTLLSVCIETVQYFTGLGLAEFDDVISNTLGGAIGMWLSGGLHPGKSRTK